MIRKTLIRQFSPMCVLIGLMTGSVWGETQPVPQPPEEINTYWIDAAMVSFDASGSLDSYRGGGNLGGSPGSTLGTSTPDSDICIEPHLESNRLYADVTIEQRGTSDNSVAKKQRFDFTSLRPQVLDLGTAKDGRTYHLNLIPTVRKVKVRPKSFREAADDLYRLKFHQSRIILNDEQYVGRMLASDSLVFSMEVSDVASIEFSLLHLKGAQPLGRLQDGRITIRHPDGSHPAGTTLEIDSVTNGSNDRLVEDGPYEVWVRWNKSQVTGDEYRAQLAAYRDQIKNGDMFGNEGALKAIDKELARKPGPWVVSTGAREPQKNEIEE
jgi:hypothetical protein